MKLGNRLQRNKHKRGWMDGWMDERPGKKGGRKETTAKRAQK
jgi:hypothetical protein